MFFTRYKLWSQVGSSSSPFWSFCKSSRQMIQVTIQLQVERTIELFYISQVASLSTPWSQRAFFPLDSWKEDLWRWNFRKRYETIVATWILSTLLSNLKSGPLRIPHSIQNQPQPTDYLLALAKFLFQNPELTKPVQWDVPCAPLLSISSLPLDSCLYCISIFRYLR